MKEQKGFIQIPLLIAIIAGILVIGGASYFGVKKYQNYQAEKTEKERQGQAQQQVSQEQPVKTTPKPEIKVQKEFNNVGLENCLSEASVWFNQAKQTAKEVLEEEKMTYNPYQAFIDQHASSLDEIIVSLSEELEDYKAECYKKYPQR